MIVDRLLSPEQAGKLLGCKRTTVYKMIREKRIDSVKMGGLRRIRLSTIQEYMAELEAV